MTTKPEPVVSALERFLTKEITYSFDGRQKASNIINEALPLARDLYRYKELVEWIWGHDSLRKQITGRAYIDEAANKTIPPLIKELLEGKKG